MRADWQAALSPYRAETRERRSYRDLHEHVLALADAVRVLDSRHR